MNKKIIIFNGPSDVGKSVAMSAVNKRLADKGYRAVQLDMAAPLKKAVHALVGTTDHWDKYDHGDDKPNKDKVHPLMFGHTPRQLYVEMNDFAESTLGEHALARILCNQFTNMKMDIALIQCGTVVETQVIVDVFGKDNVFILEIEREGCDFDDYRVYTASSVKCESRRVPNIEGERTLFYEFCIVTIAKFLGVNLEK